MTIINQDRDFAIEYHGQHIFGGVNLSDDFEIISFNLYVEGSDKLLGSFDDEEELAAEIDAIRNCEASVYYVSGFAAWDECLLEKVLGKNAAPISNSGRNRKGYDKQ